MTALNIKFIGGPLNGQTRQMSHPIATWIAEGGADYRLQIEYDEGATQVEAMYYAFIEHS